MSCLPWKEQNKHATAVHILLGFLLILDPKDTRGSGTGTCATLSSAENDPEIKQPHLHLVETEGRRAEAAASRGMAAGTPPPPLCHHRAQSLAFPEGTCLSPHPCWWERSYREEAPGLPCRHLDPPSCYRSPARPYPRAPDPCHRVAAAALVLLPSYGVEPRTAACPAQLRLLPAAVLSQAHLHPRLACCCSASSEGARDGQEGRGVGGAAADPLALTCCCSPSRALLKRRAGLIKARVVACGFLRPISKVMRCLLCRRYRSHACNIKHFSYF